MGGVQRDLYLQLHGARFDHNKIDGSILIKGFTWDRYGRQRALARKPETNGILIRTSGVSCASAYDEKIT